MKAPLLAILAATLAIAGPSAAAEQPQVRVDAGLNGLARPGRWMPVRVTLENGRDDLTGEVVVEWGDARVRRTIALAPAARRQYELYARTPNVRDAVVVHLEAGGRSLQTVETPVRIVRFDEPFVTCVGSTPGAACTVTLEAKALPTSWRGYDAADEIVARSTDPAVAADKQRAIDVWRALRDLDDGGRLTRAADPPPTSALRPALSALFVVYLVAIPATMFVARRIARTAAGAYASVATLIIVFTTGAVAIGRAGPGSSIAIRYSGTVHQLPGISRSFVSIRGSAELPTAGRFELRAPFGDGAIEPAGGRGDHRFDEDGYPVLSGNASLAARRAFIGEGVAELAVVEVSSRASSTHISNVSEHTLDDCGVRAGGSNRPLGSLEPRANLDIAGATRGEAVSLTCSVPAAVLPFAASGRSVDAEGRVQLVVHLPAAPGQP